MVMGFPWKMSHGMGQHALHTPGTHGTETDEQDIENLLNEHSDSEYECQNDNKFCTLLNFKVSEVNKFCCFVSFLVRVVLSSTHYT